MTIFDYGVENPEVCDSSFSSRRQSEPCPGWTPCRPIPGEISDLKEYKIDVQCRGQDQRTMEQAPGTTEQFSSNLDRQLPGSPTRTIQPCFN